MRLAITSKGMTLDADVDPRFGRGAYFIIIDTDTMAFEVIDNAKNVNVFKGAGIQAASAISKSGAKALLTGYCGPNAFKTLSAAGIKVANDAAGTVLEAVNAFNDGKYTFAEESNTEGHW